MAVPRNKHRHIWVTVITFGYWGQLMRCRGCHKTATFVINEGV